MIHESSNQGLHPTAPRVPRRLGDWVKNLADYRFISDQILDPICLHRSKIHKPPYPVLFSEWEAFPRAHPFSDSGRDICAARATNLFCFFWLIERSDARLGGDVAAKTEAMYKKALI
jgi:hypothetical protein